MVEWLKPLTEAGLCLGFHQGNHEFRIWKESGVNIAKAMAKEIGCPYLGDACWSDFVVGDQHYAIYSLHGATGAQRDGTCLTQLENTASSFHADVVAMGHAHKCVDGIAVCQYLDLKSKTIKEKKKFLIVCGHYLGYQDSYWMRKGGKISKLGSPKVKFFRDRHDIHISW
jgi:hypothetical protein